MQSSHEINAMIGVMYLFCMVIGLIPKKGLILNISRFIGDQTGILCLHILLWEVKKKVLFELILFGLTLKKNNEHIDSGSVAKSYL